MERKISDLINELQQLQIRQQQLTNEILAAERSNELNTDNEREQKNTRITTRPEILDNDGTELRIGDTVKILNKGLFKETTGVITKLGKSRVSIRLDSSGQVTTRKSSNLRLIEGKE
jgi:uncharacterized Zn ribbon protein